MAVNSFPWTQIGNDRDISADAYAAFLSAVNSNKVLTGLAPTLVGGNVNVSAGTAIAQGRVVVVDATASLTPTANRRARIVLRVDLANRTASVALSGTSTTLPNLTRTGAMWELGLGTVDTTGTTTVVDTRTDFTLCGMYDTGWQNVPFESGFSGTAQVRRLGDLVHFRGSIATSLGSSSVTPLVIPEGYRPTDDTGGAVTFRGNGNTATISGGVNVAGSLGCRNIDSTGRTVTAMSGCWPAT